MGSAHTLPEAQPFQTHQSQCTSLTVLGALSTDAEGGKQSLDHEAGGHRREGTRCPK